MVCFFLKSDRWCMILKIRLQKGFYPIVVVDVMILWIFPKGQVLWVKILQEINFFIKFLAFSFSNSLWLLKNGSRLLNLLGLIYLQSQIVLQKSCILTFLYQSLLRSTTLFWTKTGKYLEVSSKSVSNLRGLDL